LAAHNPSAAAAAEPLPLGELLVQRGVLTREQLELALVEQRETGRPLGEIIVTRGLAPGPIVAQALATQHGGPVKTEYGFATGWTDVPAQQPQQPQQPPTAAAPDPRDRVIAELRAWAESAQTAITSRDDAIAARDARIFQLEQAISELQAAAPAEDAGQLRETIEELERAAATRDEAMAVRDERILQLEQTIASLEADRPDTGEIERLQATIEELRAAAATHADALAQAHEAAASRDGELAMLREKADAYNRDLGSLEGARADLARRLENASTRAATLAARVEEQTQALAERDATIEEHLRTLEELAQRVTDLETTAAATPADRWAMSESHLLFFRDGAQYELVERHGPPPAPGELVDGRVVLRIGGDAIPGRAVPCAYLGD
jgi:hypothetical protein